ncbi:MAG: MarR family transcriptional regulator [candidate division WOR-3 bacterium]
MSKKENFYLAKLEWLGPILVRGLRVLSSVEALGQEFSFSQVMILQTLLREKTMQMKDLAKYLGLSKANATGLVDRLVKKGLIERTHSVEDRRAVLVKLTPTGTHAATKLAAINRKGLAQMMRRIPEKNLVVFLNTLEMVARDLTKIAEP